MLPWQGADLAQCRRHKPKRHQHPQILWNFGGTDGVLEDRALPSSTALDVLIRMHSLLLIKVFGVLLPFFPVVF